MGDVDHGVARRLLLVEHLSLQLFFLRFDLLLLLVHHVLALLQLQLKQNGIELILFEHYAVEDGDHDGDAGDYDGHQDCGFCVADLVVEGEHENEMDYHLRPILKSEGPDGHDPPKGHGLLVAQLHIVIDAKRVEHRSYQHVFSHERHVAVPFNFGQCVLERLLNAQKTYELVERIGDVDADEDVDVAAPWTLPGRELDQDRI